MPKLSLRYDDHIMFICDHSLRLNLMAWSFMEGDKGIYARLCRNILTHAVEDRLLEMDTRERKKFDDILFAVKAEYEMKQQSKADRQRDKAKKQAG